MNTILVVEDNDDHWFLTRWALLRTWPGVQFHRTANKAETMEYLTACSNSGSPLPKLILLDLYLPEREDGWALLDLLKHHHAFRQLPVVILSYSDHPDDIRLSYARYSASYIVKPTSYPDWLLCFENFYRYWSTEVMLPRA